MSVDTSFAPTRRRHEDANRQALGRLFAAMEEDVRARFGTGVRTLLTPRWDDRLKRVVFDRAKDTATEIGGMVADRLTPDRGAQGLERRFDPDLMDPWLDEFAGFAASDFNDATRDDLADVADVEDLDHTFDLLRGWRMPTMAASMVTTAASFGAQDAARASGAGRKTWRTTSGEPRESHLAVDGESVALEARFSNGLRFPGDPAGGADEVANCVCVLEVA